MKTKIKKPKKEKLEIATFSAPVLAPKTPIHQWTNGGAEVLILKCTSNQKV